MSEEAVKILLCPACLGSLERESSEAAVSCGACGRSHPVRDGFPLLGPPRTSAASKVVKELAEGSAEAELRLGALEAVRDGRLSDQLYTQRLRDPAAAAPAVLANGGPGARLLHLGSGWGRGAALLARNFGGGVVLLDPDPASLALSRRVAREEGVLLLAGAVPPDDPVLPVEEASVDCVFLDIAVRSPRRYLDEARRVLRPGGLIVVLHEASTRSPLRALRPPWWKALAFGREGPASDRVWNLFPNRRRPRLLLPRGEGARIVPHARRLGDLRLRDRLRALLLDRLHGSGAAILGEGTPFLQRLARTLEERAGLEGRAERVLEVAVTTASGLAVHTSGPRGDLHVALGLDRASSEELARDHRHVKLLARRASDLRPHLPRRLYDGNLEGWPLYVTDRIERRGPAEPDAALPVVRTLAGLRAQPSPDETQRLEEEIEAFDCYGIDVETRRRYRDALWRRRREAGEGRHAVHGDLVPENVLLTREGGAVVVDWGDFEPAGFPLTDLFHLHIYPSTAARRGWAELARRARGPLPSEPMEALARSILRVHPEELGGLGPERLSALFLLYLHGALARQLRFRRWQGPACREVVKTVIEAPDVLASQRELRRRLEGLRAQPETRAR